ncbi:hypothetical protein FIV00_02900 [Labrenzia sp. THAF82]|uniref:hypothetical protein n=1 Tax=Labrenzia sp. THAF82 TaxID=2587861 RepID=UPI00126803F7|nr:hypothetical protein [Labrenzia sp. THAF82]QFT29423.1 hypothetical protein FIV00_02900 [Labrenzia sp. THAF82]
MAKFMRDRARKQLALEPLRIREPREAVRILSARVITYFQSKAARFKAWRMNDPTIYNLAATKYLENLACKLESGEDAYKQSLFNQSPRAKLDELLKEASDLYEDILAREVKELSAKKALTENKKNLACNKLVNAQNFTENTSELQKIKEEAQQVKDSAGKEIDAIQAKIDECEEVKNLGKAANEGIKEEFNKRIAKNIRDFLKNNENISPSNARLAVKRAWYENGKKLSEAMCTIVSQEIARLKLIGDNYGEGIIDADVVIKHIEQWKRMSATIGLIINVNELNSGNGQVAQSPPNSPLLWDGEFHEDAASTALHKLPRQHSEVSNSNAAKNDPDTELKELVDNWDPKDDHHDVAVLDALVALNTPKKTNDEEFDQLVAEATKNIDVDRLI